MYGGVVDVYFKVAALHAIGCEIHLHCFVTDDRLPSPELKAVAKAVHFYRVSRNPFLAFSRLPFSVASRNHPQLEKNIAAVDAPILFDGLKTAMLASRNRFSDRKRILRLHNIEQDYFAGVAQSETSFVKRLLFSLESWKYKRFEPVISRFDRVASLSKHEDAHVNAMFGNSEYVPVFHGNKQVAPLEGFGQYALYHGDLRTSDNVRSALFLASVFADIPDVELVIASGTRNPELDRALSAARNVRFVAFSNFEELQEMFGRAHINISWSFQQSGTKLKLVNALFNGRHSIINANITDDQILSGLCTLAHDRGNLREAVVNHMMRPYDDHQRRSEVLSSHLDDKANALRLVNLFR